MNHYRHDRGSSIKRSRPFPSDLKTDQEVLKARETVKSNF